MLCHQALLPSAAVWGLGNLWWGEPEWGHPPHLHWGCRCCCDLLKHQGLIRQVAKCIRSCWARRVLPPAWLYNHLSIKQPHFGVWGRLWGDFFGICPCMCIMLFDSSLPVQMCAWLQHAHPSWPICLGVKDEPNRRFGVLGLTSTCWQLWKLQLCFLFWEERKKPNPVWFVPVIAADLGWIVTKSLCDYTLQSPQYVHKATKKKKRDILKYCLALKRPA